VELVKPFKMFNRCAPFNRSALFFRHFERLKRLERFEPSVSALRFTVCVMLFPGAVNNRAMPSEKVWLPRLSENADL
jgi:hypothetical protein